MTSGTQPWYGWRDAVFGSGYQIWHDGPSFLGLTFRARDEPGEVARMLRLGLEAGDPVAAQALAALHADGLAPPDAPEWLRAAAGTGSGTFLVRVGQALFALTGDESWSAAVASVLADPGWYERMDAVIALAGFAPTPELVEAVTRARDDEKDLVRAHARDTLAGWGHA